MKDLFDLSGKKAVITGGRGLLGLQHARALLQKNCEVDLWDIKLQDSEDRYRKLLDEFPNGVVTSIEIDITSDNQVAGLLRSGTYKNKRIDILVNNAALNPKYEHGQESTSNFENYAIDMWNKEIAVGLTGAFLCSQHIGKKMADQGGGVILNIASDLSVIAPDQRIYERKAVSTENQFKKPVSYSVIKAGLVGLTKYLSTYWAQENIRVNALSPGGVFERQDSEFVDKLVRLIPMNRMANVDEYVGAIQFLCSDASCYMTGQNILMDGGRSVW